MGLGAEGGDDGMNCVERSVFAFEHEGRVFPTAGFHEIVLLGPDFRFGSDFDCGRKSAPTVVGNVG